MAGFTNWTKEYEDDDYIEFRNTAVGVLTIAEKSGDMWEAYISHPHPGIDGGVVGDRENWHFGQFSSKSKAQRVLREYRKDHTFEQYEDDMSEQAAFERIFPDPVRDNDKVDVRVNDNGPMITGNSYHMLKKYLEVTEESQMFQGMYNLLRGTTDMSGYEAIQHLTDQDVEYTYNFGDQIIHPDFQYVMFAMDATGRPEPVNDIYDAEYMAVQIHTGRDARVGFSSWHIFAIDAFDVASIITAMYDVEAVAGDRHWRSDDGGYNWYGEGGAPDLSFGDDSMAEHWRLEPDEDAVYDRKTGQRVTFRVMF